MLKLWLPVHVLPSRTVPVVSVQLSAEFSLALLSCNVQLSCCLRPAKDGEVSILPPVSSRSLCSVQYSTAASKENQLVTVVGSELKINRKNYFLFINSSLKKMNFMLHGTNCKFFRISILLFSILL